MYIVREDIDTRWSLVRPSMDYADEIAAYRQEFLDAGDSMDGTGHLRRFADPAAWLAEVARYEDPATVPTPWVPMTQFMALDRSDGRLAGMIQVRHGFNDYLEKYAGHIGYSVRPSKRRLGCAAWMLGRALPFCRAIGLEKVLVTCLEGNEASRRTILANGGVYESTVLEPEIDRRLERYWIDVRGISPWREI